MEVINTARTTLRPILRDDAAALFPTLSDEAHCRYSSRGAFADEEDLADWLVDPDWTGRTWVAIERASGELVGRFILVPTSEIGMSEIGYITVAKWQGRGIARECVSALISHAFAVEGQRRLVANIDAENIASIALIERLGFQREGRLREHETTHKGRCDILVYGLLRHEWTPPEPFS
jgi:RimJ/RimL family protein N-acetyltransferase